MRLLQKILVIVLSGYSTGLLAQIDRDGNPVSWSLGQHVVNSGIWQVQSLLDTEPLIQADAQTADDRSAPMRFAFSRSVNYDLKGSGRWTNLPNGDRIWVLGIESQGAFSIGVTFSHFKIPEGAKLYIYSDDRSDVIGPLTSANNRLNQLMTAPPVEGSKIVIEYYEPYAFRGQGEIQIHSFAHAYRNLKDLSRVRSNTCFQLYGSEEFPEVSTVASSVMMMLVDNGQRIATATLVNNSAQDGTPYAITARSAMVGNSASWVFLFGVSGEGCSGDTPVSCWNKAICGAQVVQTDNESGLTLLKLKGSPRNDWSAYYAGWNRSSVNSSSFFTSLQHNGGAPQSVAITSAIQSGVTWQDKPVFSVESWDLGVTSSGSIGSPLFDADFNLIGVYVGGNLQCNGVGADYFVPISESWPRFSSYLDVYSTSAPRIAGMYAEFNKDAGNQKMQISFFPNPAQDWIYVRNEQETPIDKIVIYDGMGREVLQLRPNTPTIDVSELPNGVYLLNFYSAEQISTARLLIR